MVQIHYKTAFENMTLEQIKEWVKLYADRLVGSAIFTKSNTITSKLVSWGETHLFAKVKDCDKKFVPSHTGSIIYYCDDIYIFDMKPPRACVQPLAAYLYDTEDDYVLVLRDFELDTRMFSLNCQFHIGEFYPYLSALRSVFTKRQSKWRTHCSELHARMLDLCGHKFPEDFNFECTPDELYHVMAGDNK